jgi:hypothetical protein
VKKFIVSIYARSRSLDPGKITRLMGVSPSGSHLKGDLSASGKSCYLDHFWWLGSGLGEDGTMDDYGGALMAILSQMSSEVPDLVASRDLDLTIGVGILYDTYTTSVRLPREFVAFASRIGAVIEVHSYPTEFDEKDERS